MRARQQFQLGRTAPAARWLTAVLHERPPTVLVAWTPADAWVLAARLALRSGSRGQALRAVRRRWRWRPPSTCSARCCRPTTSSS